MRYLSSYSQHDVFDMSDLNSKRFTLRRPPKLATISRKSMDELEFVKELLARLPTRRDQALVPVSATQWPVVAHNAWLAAMAGAPAPA